MKFYGKVFLNMIILVSLSFGIFGTLLIQASFRSALNREIEMGISENQMLKLAFETTMNSLPGAYSAKPSETVKEVAQSIDQGMNSKESVMQLVDSDGGRIYAGGTEKVDDILLNQVSQEFNGYRIYQEGDCYYLNVMSEVDMRLLVEEMMLQTTTDITHIYEEREELLQTYRMIMFIVLGSVAVVAMVLSFFLTRSVRHLSGVARSFAKGQMEARAVVKSHDEVGVLAQDFNEMADRLSDRMLSLEDQAKRQEDFTSAFAHELKTPLTSIIGYADMIRSMDLNEEERIKAAGYIYSQGKRLEALSFKLLELMVLKKQDFEFVNLDAYYLIQLVFDLAEVGCLEKNVVLKMEAEQGKIYGEKDLLISLFTNLIDNSKKASKEGDIIRIEGKKGKDGYEVIVRDEGRGIPKEELSKITEAFYMVDKSRSRKEGGAGLGMTLCSRIVHLHQAKWSIESELEKGTCITVTFLQEADE